MDDALWSLEILSLLSLAGWLFAFCWTAWAGRKKAGLSRKEFAASIFAKSLVFFVALCSITMIVSMGFFAFVLIPALMSSVVAAAFLYVVALLLYPYRAYQKMIMFGTCVIMVLIIAAGWCITVVRDQREAESRTTQHCQELRRELTPAEFARSFGDICP